MPKRCRCFFQTLTIVFHSDAHGKWLTHARHALLLDHAIAHGVLLQGAFLCLDAEIDQRSLARTLRATAHCGCDPHDTAGLHGNLVAIQGEDALAAQDDVKLLVQLVMMEEGNGLTRSQ